MNSAPPEERCRRPSTVKNFVLTLAVRGKAAFHCSGEASGEPGFEPSQAKAWFASYSSQLGYTVHGKNLLTLKTTN